MTTLEAVNIILAAISQAPVTALATGTRSDVGDAESYLDRANTQIQREGWHCNEEYDVELTLPTIRLTVGGTTGTWQWGETVTQAVSGATGTLAYELTVGATKYVYVVPVSGTFNGSNNISGGTSSASRTVSAVATVTEARHAVGLDVLSVRPSRTTPRDFSKRGVYLYDLLDNTFNWEDDIQVDLTRELDFTDLPPSLAMAIARQAAMEFQDTKKKGNYSRQRLMQDALIAMSQARQEDADARQTNTVTSRSTRVFKGPRSTGIESIHGFDHYN